MTTIHQSKLNQVVAYMKSHWPSDVREEWQVPLEDYPTILARVVADFTAGATTSHQLIRIAGLSGSGKTTQILPAVEAYAAKHDLSPILVAARRFVEYHPHYQEILQEYGKANLRKKTDEFSTIMMFLTLDYLTKYEFDVILDVTLLDPAIEQILMEMLKANHYKFALLMIAASPTVTAHFLGGRSWRHTPETEAEFVRATTEALEYYANHHPTLRVILWSVYDLDPIYDGKISDALSVFQDYSTRTTLPASDDAARAAAKIKYLSTVDLG